MVVKILLEYYDGRQNSAEEIGFLLKFCSHNRLSIKILLEYYDGRQNSAEDI